MLDMKFQDGSRETYGESKINQDGSWGTGGIQIPTQYGPSSTKHSITVLSNHLTPQAGLTIYNDKIKLLVSTDNQASSVLKLSLVTNFKTIHMENQFGWRYQSAIRFQCPLWHCQKIIGSLMPLALTNAHQHQLEYLF